MQLIIIQWNKAFFKILGSSFKKLKNKNIRNNFVL